MTPREWKPIAQRINRLWPPVMDGMVAEEYFAVLEPFPAWALDKAVTQTARMPRTFRPDVGTLYEAAEALTKAAQDKEPAPELDPLSAEEHRAVLAEEGRRQSAEHRRRHEAVIDLLRKTGYRIPLTELPGLMAEKDCTAAQFDARMASHRAKARAAPASGRELVGAGVGAGLLDTDPQGAK